MATDRETVTKQVKEANDIVDVVGNYLTLRPAGGKYKGLCPFHQDHNPSLVIDPQWQNFRCWACQKAGDVFTFIQEIERVNFLEARELLARRAGISLEKTADSPQNRSRAVMLDVMRWADEQYQNCLLKLPLAETARRYLGERHLNDETVRRFGLGFSPPSWDWLVEQAGRARVPFDMLEQVGLIGRRKEGSGHYDRFRDRIMFPIRNTRSQTVGFGGRILPSSPSSAKGSKYYNSSETPLFTKSEHLYGLDQARQAGSALGYLAVVEGYTDVLMAQQFGIANVVATLGTALNARHVQHLRRYVPRVVLVFDADAGGTTGVDRALEIFVSQDVDLAVAALPEGLDPCDLLVQRGAEPLRLALANAVGALEFKLDRLLATTADASIEVRRRAIDELLAIIARAPELTGRTGQMKRELVLSTIASRFGIQEPTLWARLRELRQEETTRASRRVDAEASRQVDAEASREGEASRRVDPGGQAPAPQAAPAPVREKELLEVLLAEPRLVALAAEAIRPEEMQHPGLRKLLAGLYQLRIEGTTPDLDQLRARLDNPRLDEYALRRQAVGQANPNRAAWLERLIEEFRNQEELRRKQQLKQRLPTTDDVAAVELLRQLQARNDWKI